MIRAGKGLRRLLEHCAPAALLVPLALAPGAVMAQEQVQVKRPAELREAPGEGSRSLGALAVQTPVVRLGERHGPWIKVGTTTAPGTVGWLHMFDVAAPGTPGQGGNAATGALRGITSFFNKGSGQAPATHLATSTVGIRGLGAEDIANALPNPAAVSRIEAMRIDAGQARQFAAQASLTSQTVEALPEPPGPGAPAASGQGINNENTP